MPPRTAKMTVAALGVLLLAIPVGVVLSWEGIQIQYQLYRLKNEPGYLKQVVSAPEESIQQSALAKYLKTADGKEQLFELFFETHERMIALMSSRIRRMATATTARAGGVVAIQWTDRGFEFLINPKFRTGTDDQFRASLGRLLRYLAGRSFTSEELLMEFSFENVEELGEDRGDLRYFGFPDHSTRGHRHTSPCRLREHDSAIQWGQTTCHKSMYKS